MDFELSLEENLRHFKHKENEFSQVLKMLRKSYKKLMEVVKKVENFCSSYDLDENTPGNGYRSFVDLCYTFIEKSNNTCKQLKLKRDNLLFSNATYIKELKSDKNIFEDLVRVGESFIANRDISGGLFTDVGNYENDITKIFDSMDHLEGFKSFSQIEMESMKVANKTALAALAAHSHCYFSKQPTFVKCFHFLFSYIYYLICPQASLKRSVEIFDTTGVGYFKDAIRTYENWFLTTFGYMTEPKVQYNKNFRLDVAPLQILNHDSSKLVDIPVPNCKFIKFKLVKAKKQAEKRSKYLIFHLHGGGFIAQTPKGHGAYLKQWARELKIPILSVNYSHSPKSPFPQALNECFYMYCHALKYPERYGWSGENVVFCGDSAGANLVTACTIKCIEFGIRKPTGLFNAYGVFLARYANVPSRFLAFYDIVIPYYLYNRIFRAYLGVKDKTKLNPDGSIQRTEIENLDDEIFKNYLVSPYYTPGNILKEFPPTYIISTNRDPCLDECVEFAKQLKKNNSSVKLEILKNLHHGFLNFSSASPDCCEGSLICVERIRKLLQMSSDD